MRIMNQFKTCCPHCETQLSVPNNYKDQNIKCGVCQKDFLATPIIEASYVASPVVTATTAKEPIRSSQFKIIQAAILCFIFGGLGVHAFFTGNRSQGAILLSLTIVGLILYTGSPSYRGIGAIGMLVSYVFALGDLLRLLMSKYKDGEGKLMTTWS